MLEEGEHVTFVDEITHVKLANMKPRAGQATPQLI